MTAPTGDRPNAFAEALRAAVSERGITLARLRRQLADDGNVVSMATLSYCVLVIASRRVPNPLPSSRASRTASAFVAVI